MRRITQKRYTVEAPARQWVLIDHRIFQNYVGTANESRHVKPIEMPIGDCANEIVNIPGTAPVTLLLVMRRLDVDDPINQLASLIVDIVANRINQNFCSV